MERVLRLFFSRCGKHQPLLLLIKTTTRRIFGSYISVSLEKSQDKSQFKGNGEMFLFGVFPHVKRYPWTRADTFFITIETKAISIGNGGLWFNETRGYSARGTTFDNDPLAEEREFEIADIEVFGFV
eukprot:TRINITY_DN25977_c0_g1_i1.p1 TRINITY_DN25977_c0_g1~~TRINITY_DN25977_c0_g1_i1.p1  ORF type:complete len:127 (-),score=20.11 TRINITY_DN25977_c0_g1_i1:30-410(-)